MTGSKGFKQNHPELPAAPTTNVDIIYLEPSCPVKQDTSASAHMEIRQDLKYMFRSLGLNEVLIIFLHSIEEISGDMKEVYDFLIIEHQVKHG